VTVGYGGATAVPFTAVIAPANTAPVASAVVSDPDPGNGVVSATVNASDADGDELSYTAAATTAKGTVVVSSNGNRRLHPDCRGPACRRRTDRLLGR
jgi:hypothetical protein